MRISFEVTNVQSSTIDRIVYYANNTNVESFLDYPTNMFGDLMVQFKNGQEYIYRKVPMIHVTKILTSESIGTMFNVLIVKGGFEFEKI